MPSGVYNRTEEHRNKLRGWKHTEEAKRNISLHNAKFWFGKTLSEAHKQKLKENSSHNKYWLGKSRSEDTKEKLRKYIGEKASGWKGGVTLGDKREEYFRKKSLERVARKNNADGSHTQQEWEDLKKRYNYMCLCCKREEPEIKLTEDHIIPLSKKGSDFIENIQPLCLSCNSRKATKIINFCLVGYNEDIKQGKLL